MGQFLGGRDWMTQWRLISGKPDFYRVGHGGEDGGGAQRRIICMQMIIVVGHVNGVETQFFRHDAIGRDVRR
ncbi:MAG: hypothetical protein ACJAU6_001512 [Alphaproteobacteria bacterium]|jgi:hypothetical protein